MSFTYNIVSRIAVLREYENNGETWRKELNCISWNDREPKLDIREWNGDHTKCTKGITLTPDEASKLYMALNDIVHERS